MSTITVAATYLGTSRRKRRNLFFRARNGLLTISRDHVTWQKKRRPTADPAPTVTIERASIVEIDTAPILAHFAPLTRLIGLVCSDGQTHTFQVPDRDARRILIPCVRLVTPDDENAGATQKPSG